MNSLHKKNEVGVNSLCLPLTLISFFFLTTCVCIFSDHICLLVLFYFYFCHLTVYIVGSKTVVSTFCFFLEQK